MRPPSPCSKTGQALAISEITKGKPMNHLLWFENGKAGSLDPIPLNSSPFFCSSKSCQYNLDHLQHLHLQGVLWSIEFYEYFIKQNLTTGLGLRSRGRRKFLGSAFRGCLQGLRDPWQFPPSLKDRGKNLSSPKSLSFCLCCKKSWDLLFFPPKQQILISHSSGG